MTRKGAVLIAVTVAGTAVGAYTLGHRMGYEQGDEVGYNAGANAAIIKLSVDLENEALGCARSGAPDCSNYAIIEGWVRGYIETHANAPNWVEL